MDHGLDPVLLYKAFDARPSHFESRFLRYAALRFGSSKDYDDLSLVKTSFEPPSFVESILQGLQSKGCFLPYVPP